MIKETLKTKRHILVELRVKGYTEFFLTNFIKFLKQRFFKNFIKLGNTTLIFNKYTLLRSAFINKSSREQIEKRISINKINFIFSESDFKFFYSTLNSLNFKGVSLKISKFYFLVLKNKLENNIVNKTSSYSKIFFPLWKNLLPGKKNLILIYSKKRKLNQVFTAISCKNLLSKHIGLKFLRNKSLRKNRLKKGLFKTILNKPNFNEIMSLKKAFHNFNFEKRKTILKLENSFLKRNSSIFSLCYSYCFNNNNKEVSLSTFLPSSDIFTYLSKKEIIKLDDKKFLLNSILLYRKFFIWSSFRSNRKTSDYRRGLSKKVILDKFNIFYKLVLGFKTSPFNLHTNFFLRNNFPFLLIKDKVFYLFLKKLNKIKFDNLKTILKIKSLSFKTSNQLSYSHLIRIYKKSKKNNVVSINPFLIRRYLTKNLTKKKNTFVFYEKNSLIKFFNSNFHFRTKIFLFLVLWYKSRLSQLSNRKKKHLQKRFSYCLRRKWGTVWKSKSKTRFFFRLKKKKKFWKKINRKFKYKKKKKIFKKSNTKKRYWLKKKKKKNLNLFRLKINNNKKK